jgi:predicted membrane chloride channel (bestrophin family)
LWVLLFPFAVHDEFIKAGQMGLPTLPAASLLALFLFDIEELAVKLEVPFSILPMLNICDEIKDTANGMINESKTKRDIYQG